MDNILKFTFAIIKSKLKYNYETFFNIIKVRKFFMPLCCFTISKFIFYMLFMYVIGFIFNNLGIENYTYIFYSIVYILLSLEFIFVYPRKILSDSIKNVFLLSNLSDKEILNWNLIINFLAFKLSGIDKLLSAAIFICISIKIKGIILILILNIIFYCMTLIKCRNLQVYKLKIEKNYIFTEIIKFILTGSIIFVLSRIFLSFLIPSVNSIKNILNSQPLSTQMLINIENILNEFWQGRWFELKVKFFYILTYIHKNISYIYLVVFLFLSLLILVAYFKYIKVSENIRIKQYKYIPSKSKKILFKLLFKMTDKLKCDLFTKTNLYNLYNSSEIAEKKILSYFIPLEVVLFLIILNNLLDYINNPFIIGFLIIFISINLLCNNAQALNYNLKEFFRYKIDYGVINYFRMSEFSFKKLYLVKLKTLKILNLLPTFILVILSIISYLNNMKFTWYSLIFIIINIVIIISYFNLANSMCLYMGPYVFSKSYINNLNIDNIDDNVVEENLYLKFYLFFKNILILPPFYILLVNSIIGVFKGNSAALYLLGYLIFLIVFKLIFDNQSKKIINKGLCEIDKISL